MFKEEKETCAICNKELGGKYILRFHLETQHTREEIEKYYTKKEVMKWKQQQ